MSGLFITFEGPDGSGKTTQAKLLQEYLEKKGFSVLLTREPGGNSISEKIRDIIIDTENKKMSKRTEALLYAAARAQIVNQVIVPALKAGQVVICDRFVDSSLVYQGIARNLGVEQIEQLNLFATDGIEPDITFLLSLEPEKGIERKKEQKQLDRIEQESLYFHTKVFFGYLEIARKFPERIKEIEASDDINVIHENVVGYVEKMISKGFL